MDGLMGWKFGYRPSLLQTFSDELKRRKLTSQVICFARRAESSDGVAEMRIRKSVNASTKWLTLSLLNGQKLEMLSSNYSNVERTLTSLLFSHRTKATFCPKQQRLQATSCSLLIGCRNEDERMRRSQPTSVVWFRMQYRLETAEGSLGGGWQRFGRCQSAFNYYLIIGLFNRENMTIGPIENKPKSARYISDRFISCISSVNDNKIIMIKIKQFNSNKTMMIK